MKIKIHYLKPSIFLRILRSIWVSRKVTERKIFAPIRIHNLFLGINISVAPTAKFICNGVLRIGKWNDGNDPISISLAENSTLVIDGDFTIGNGTRIVVCEGASLYIGGRRNESAAGITEKSMIMARKKIHIGTDCIIAWNVFITDCDWHTIDGKNIQEDVRIGNHVWIACNTSILKGAKIGNNCIIGAHSLVSRKSIPDNTLAAGNPIRVIENDIQWSRDMLQEEELKDF